MTGVRPRRWAHRGSVLASGLVLDTRLISAPEAVARILAMASHEPRVLRLDALLVVAFGAPARIDCAAAAGAPLVRHGRLLAALPLDVDERAVLELAVDAVAIAVAGRVTVRPLDELPAEDLASWVDVSRFELVADVDTLGEVTGAPASRVIVPSADVRQALGATPLPGEASDIVRTLVRRDVAAAAPSRSIVDSIRGWLWRKLTVRTQPSAAGRANRALVVARPATHGWWFRLRSSLRKAVMRSALGAVLGRRQARYLARTLEMFESNRLDDALRHAIPFRVDVASALTSLGLRLPAPRAQLSIVPARQATSSAIGVGGELFDELRRHYRRAFDRLVAAGEIDKAAFVLAELLRADEEAIAFLEQHQRFALAAQIAEARGLPPGLAIRLWFLAGDRDRAIRIARQTGAFGDAVTRLATTHADESRALRLLWADVLASSGAYAAAVDAVWPVPTAHDLALAWIDRAIAVGGAVGAMMLARKARLAPAAFAEVRDHMTVLLDDPHGEPRVVRALADELATGAATPETRVLARLVARRVLRNDDPQDRDRLRRLLDGSGDAVLRADVRGPRAAPAPSTIEEPAAFRRSAGQGVSQRTIHLSAHARSSARPAISYRACRAHVSFLDEPAGTLDALEGDAAARPAAFAVFDGVPGWEVEVPATQATVLAADTVFHQLRAQTAAGDDPGSGLGLLEAMASARRALAEATSRSAAYRDISVVATVAVLRGADLLVAHIGHVRAYVLRGETLVQITRDHLLLEDYLVDARERGIDVDPAQLAELPREILTRALGGDETEADLVGVQLAHDDTILLCSHALCAAVPDDQLRRILRESRTPAHATQILQQQAHIAAPGAMHAVVVARVTGGGLPRLTGAPVARPVRDAASITTPGTTAPRLDERREPLVIRRPTADSGALAVHDAVELPDGRSLIALGELGVWLLARDGKVQVRFAEPASQLVISDHGDRAILVARRGEAVRLSRLDLVARTVRPWCTARIDQHACDFDGATWFVACGDTVYAIDAIAEGWDHHWKVNERGTTVRALCREAAAMAIWFAGADTSGELWRYELPSLTLRARTPLAHPDMQLALGALSANGDVAGWNVKRGHAPSVVAWRADEWRQLALEGELPAGLVVATRAWIAVPAISDNSAAVHLLDARSCVVRARVELEGARRAGVRLQGGRMIVFDDRGRLLAISLRSGEIAYERRV